MKEEEKKERKTGSRSSRLCLFINFVRSGIVKLLKFQPKDRCFCGTKDSKLSGICYRDTGNGSTAHLKYGCTPFCEQVENLKCLDPLNER
jgi:hypothetical protein